MARPSETEILRFTKEIVVAHVSRNTLDPDSLLDLIRNVYTTLSEAHGPAMESDEDQTPNGALAEAEGHRVAAASPDVPVTVETEPAPRPVPAVRIEESVTPEYIVCLEDGRRFKTMKRWLKASYGMTPEQYREKWGLPPDYPMTAPNYAQAKSADAKRQGLGAGRPGRKLRAARPGRPRTVRTTEQQTKR